MLAPSRAGVTVEEAGFEGESKQLGGGLQLELLVQTLSVRLDGLDADGQLLGHLLVRVSLRQEPKHLRFAPAEPLPLLGRVRVAQRGAAPSRIWWTAQIDEGPALVHGSDRGQELDVRRLLDDIAGRTGLEGRTLICRIVVHREHQHPRGGLES